MEILGGPLFAVAGAGESHGPGFVSIVFGCPPGLLLSRGRIQTFLDRRRPGSTRHGTTRREADQIVLLSGLFSEQQGLTEGPGVTISAEGSELRTVTYEEGYTTGEPISGLVISSSGKSSDYSQFAGPEGMVRPGHTDLVRFWKSRGFADHRGGGRSSYRSTISDVFGGSIARIYLEERFGTRFFSSVTRVGDLETNRRLEHDLHAESAAPGKLPGERLREWATMLQEAEIPSLDPEFADRAAERIRQARVEGDSIGAELEVVAVNVPPLLGEPLYHSLKVRLMGVLGGLHAAQSCEVGAGRGVICRKGSDNNDPIRKQGYLANSHGGLIGGMTTGMPLVFRVGFKPTASIQKPQLSVRKNLEEVELTLQQGRHDPCVGVRAGITLESRVAIELMNAVLMQQASMVDPGQFQLFPPDER